MQRYALVSLGNASGEQICRYLPGNYRKIGFAPHDPEADIEDLRRAGPCVVIQGEDTAGWTLDGYVIPRLQSGLIAAQEIDLSHPVMKTILDEPELGYTPSTDPLELAAQIAGLARREAPRETDPTMIVSVQPIAHATYTHALRIGEYVTFVGYLSDVAAVAVNVGEELESC